MGASAFVLVNRLPCKSQLTGPCFLPYFTTVPADRLHPRRFASSLGEVSGLSGSTPYLQQLRQARALQQDVSVVG
ncbi:hypothetical protein MTO96_016584 [Rhipicephalus appendiculatus]